MTRLGVDDDGVDWDAELMQEAQRDPELRSPQALNGAIRWTILAVLAALVTACCCALSLVAGG